MRDGGSEPPIHRSLGPDHLEGNCATHNLAKGEMREEEAKRGRREGRRENSGEMQSE
jgi:hypothetical protein